MTQLARPDLARNGRDHVDPGPASATAEPLPAGRPGLSQASRPVPGWAVGTALLAPVVLVGGWLVAGALQPTSYSPMRQTMSVLAGQSATDRWIMTGALLLVGSCQIATGAGLTGVRMPARVLLILTGLSTLGIAATPEPATGPTPRHLAFADPGIPRGGPGPGPPDRQRLGRGTRAGRAGPVRPGRRPPRRGRRHAAAGAGNLPPPRRGRDRRNLGRTGRPPRIEPHHALASPATTGRSTGVPHRLERAELRQSSGARRQTEARRDRTCRDMAARVGSLEADGCSDGRGVGQSGGDEGLAA
jgi:Protein of unknown function (DUF998)